MFRIFCLSFLLGIYSCCLSHGQSDPPGFKEKEYNLESGNGIISGTLCTPVKGKKYPVVLIIPGSGPTDRDGNSSMLPGKNNSLQMLARELADEGIASVRYDKRGIAESRFAGFEEKNLRFTDYVTDAIKWLDTLKNEKSFTRVGIIGHSEGALIGMLAAQKSKVDFFISLAGAGSPADELIREQVSTQPEVIKSDVDAILDTLLQGRVIDSVNPMLYALFRPSVQPYLISWIKYDPAVELEKTVTKKLIVQGTHDLQVGIEDAERLARYASDAKLVIINNMNHVLKITTEEISNNIAAYSNPNLPVVDELVKSVVDFIKDTP